MKPELDDGLPCIEGLVFVCPHCGAEEPDDLEVTDAGMVRALRCTTCRATYFVLVVECPNCAEESVRIWSGPPSTDNGAPWVCRHCHARLEDEQAFRVQDELD
jgi:transcription elongation factor Elf1